MIASINFLRFFASYIVLTAHVPFSVVPDFIHTYKVYRFLGSIGVDIFFCISGFVMFLTQNKRGGGLASGAEFFIRRMFRIWPIYLVATIAVFIFYRSYHDFIRSIFFIQIFHHGVYWDPILLNGWSLNYEIYFYILMAILITFNFSFSAIAIINISIAITAMINKDTSYFLSSITGEFSFGILIGYIFKNEKLFSTIKTYRVFVLIISVGIFLLAMRGIDWAAPPPNTILRMVVFFPDFGFSAPRLFVWGIPAALICFSVLLFEEYFSKRFNDIGEITYSFYILQFPAIWSFEYFLKYIPAQQLTVLRNSLFLYFLLTAILLVASWLSLHWVERPGRKIGTRLAKSAAARLQSIERRPSM